MSTAFGLLKTKGFISPQVIFESLFVCTRKAKLTKPEAIRFAEFLMDNSFLQIENGDVVESVLRVFDRYLLQSYDSKIVAAALVAGCTTLYSEDMQHGLIIENTLTIINPFI
jgi:predicted nucleic acid-binding protein